MTREGALDILHNSSVYHPSYLDALNMAIEALEYEPSEDCISRQAVLDQTYNWSKDEFLRITNPFDYLRKRINSLPPITPKPKMGHPNGCPLKSVDGLIEKLYEYADKTTMYDIDENVASAVYGCIKIVKEYCGIE